MKPKTDKEMKAEAERDEKDESADILEEIVVEDLTVDGSRCLLTAHTGIIKALENPVSTGKLPFTSRPV